MLTWRVFAEPVNLYVTVTVNYKCINFYVVQAEITDELPDVLENETNLVTFNCEAAGEPIPSISWYYNGFMINVSDESEYRVSSSMNDTVITSLFTILYAQSYDAGIYTCEAENFIGNDSSSGILTINGKYMS